MQRPHVNDYLAICTTCASSRRRPSDHMDSEPSMRAHTIGPSAACLRHQGRAARAKGTTPRASATIVVTASCPPAFAQISRTASACSRSSFSHWTQRVQCPVGRCSAHADAAGALVRCRGAVGAFAARLDGFFGFSNHSRAQCSSGAATRHLRSPSTSHPRPRPATNRASAARRRGAP